MKMTVNESMFRDAFRSIRPENFTYEGLGALFEVLTDLESDVGEEYELDVIALCCEWSEATLDEIRDNYSLNDEPDEPITDEATLEWLTEQTMAYEIPGTDRVVYLIF